MAKEKKRLTVKEIQVLEPKAEIYELSPYRTYIITIKKPSIIGIDQSRAMQTAKELARILVAHNIKCAMLVNIDDDVKFLEIN